MLCLCIHTTSSHIRRSDGEEGDGAKGDEAAHLDRCVWCGVEKDCRGVDIGYI